ncbi:helix-turn-helix domain-containing protein [Neobacillus drentensis]|uniref:helix-turn-helix domain-containing protein n=1 Tax=Neobacillus drentensis TaxID=220684 RepID=UPI002FFE970E
MKSIINLTFDEDALKTIFLKEVQKRLNDLEQKTLLLDTKELCRMLSLSRPTVEKLFICKPDFPVMRIGKKLLYNRKEIEVYINDWSKNVRKKGGQVECE